MFDRMEARALSPPPVGLEKSSSARSGLGGLEYGTADTNLLEAVLDPLNLSLRHGNAALNGLRVVGPGGLPLVLLHED